MTTTKRRKKPVRNGTMRWIQFPRNLDAAIEARQDPNKKESYGQVVIAICRAWLTGEENKNPVVIPDEIIVKPGPKPKVAKSSGSPTTDKPSLTPQGKARADAPVAQDKAAGA
jgi:hypothetical protein